MDAIISDAPVTLYAIKAKNISNIRLIDQLLTEDYYGIPVPKNSPDLAAINNGLTIILGNGTYEQIY